MIVIRNSLSVSILRSCFAFQASNVADSTVFISVLYSKRRWLFPLVMYICLCVISWAVIVMI